MLELLYIGLIFITAVRSQYHESSWGTNNECPTECQCRMQYSAEFDAHLRTVNCGFVRN